MSLLSTGREARGGWYGFEPKAGLGLVYLWFRGFTFLAHSHWAGVCMFNWWDPLVDMI